MIKTRKLLLPIEYISAEKEYPFDYTISGAIYYGLPIIVNVLTTVFCYYFFKNLAVPISISRKYPLTINTPINNKPYVSPYYFQASSLCK